MTNLLSELLDELDYLSASVHLSRETSGPRTALHATLIRRLEQIKAAIKIERESDPWRKQRVYVVAHTTEEAKALAKTNGWNTRKEAEDHLRIVHSAVGSNWVMAQSYRIFKVRIFRRRKKEDIVAGLPAMLVRRV
jgi:histidinol phosphatase-like PHP family hydrolase